MTGHLSCESATDSYLWFREKTSSRFRFIRKVSVKEALGVSLMLTTLAWVPNPGTGFQMGPEDSWGVMILLTVLLIFPAWAVLYFGVRKLVARVVTSAVRRRFLDAQGLLWGNYVLSPGSIALGRITYFTPALEAIDSPHGRIYLDHGRYVVGGLPEAAAESNAPLPLPSAVTGHLSSDSAAAAWTWYRARTSRYLRFLQDSSWKERLGVGVLLTALVTLLAPGFIAPQFHYGNVVASGFWVGLLIRWSLLVGLYALLKWRWAGITARLMREQVSNAEGIMWGHYDLTADSVRFAKVTFHLAGCQAFDSPYGRIFVDAGRYRAGGFPPGEGRVAEPLSAMISPPPTAQSRRRKRSLLILLAALAVLAVTGILAAIIPPTDYSSAAYESELLGAPVHPGQLSLVARNRDGQRLLIYHINRDGEALRARIAADHPSWETTRQTVTMDGIEMQAPVLSGHNSQPFCEVHANKDYIIVEGY